VNQAYFVNRQDSARLEAEALRILRAIPGVEVIREPRGEGVGRPDFLLSAGGKGTRLVVEVKNRVSAATAQQLVEYARGLGARRLLVVAAETTADARGILADNHVALVDGLGHAHLELPQVLLHIEAGRAQHEIRQAGPPTRLHGKAGIVALLLLLHPDRDWRVQDLAAGAGVARALAHRVVTRLEGEGVVHTEGTGRNRVRRVTKRAALLDLWAEESSEKTTPVLGYGLAQTPQQLVRKVGAGLESAGIEHAFTGPAAGALVAPFITAIPVVELYVTKHVAAKDLVAASGLEEVRDGQNVVFYQTKDDAPLAFRQETNQIWIVNPFRLYADLKRDPRRGPEQAQHLRQEVIGF